MRLPALTTGSAGGSRWAMSFADLCLVLLGFLLLLQAHRGDPAALNAGIRAAFGSSAPKTYDETATSLFEPGEAILLPNANASQDGGGAANVAPRTLKAGDASQLASQLSGLMGDTFAGSYYDSATKQLVVNVTGADSSAGQEG